MDKALIAPMIAATVSILALCVTNVMTFLENRKNRNVSVITKQTIETKEKVYQNAVKILAQTNPLLLTEPRAADSKKEVLTACSGIEVLLRTTRSEGLDIINVMRALVKAFFEKNPDVKRVQELHTQFREMMSTYDSAYWSYIKHQSSGKRNKKGSLASNFKRKLEDYENTAKPEEWT